MAAGWKYFTTQVQWKRYLQDLVAENDTALLRAIVLIDGWQTEYERQIKESTEENNVGWTKIDAKEMGELATKIQNGVPLTTGELAKSRNKMRKYWKQLMQISLAQQERIKADEQAELQRIAERRQAERLRQFREYTEVLRACENGKPCEYGICDECPITRGGDQN